MEHRYYVKTALLILFLGLTANVNAVRPTTTTISTPAAGALQKEYNQAGTSIQRKNEILAKLRASGFAGLAARLAAIGTRTPTAPSSESVTVAETVITDLKEEIKEDQATLLEEKRILALQKEAELRKQQEEKQRIAKLEEEKAIKNAEMAEAKRKQEEAARLAEEEARLKAEEQAIKEKQEQIKLQQEQERLRAEEAKTKQVAIRYTEQNIAAIRKNIEELKSQLVEALTFYKKDTQAQVAAVQKQLADFQKIRQALKQLNNDPKAITYLEEKGKANELELSTTEVEEYLQYLSSIILQKQKEAAEEVRQQAEQEIKTLTEEIKGIYDADFNNFNINKELLDELKNLQGTVQTNIQKIKDSADYNKIKVAKNVALTQYTNLQKLITDQINKLEGQTKEEKAKGTEYKTIGKYKDVGVTRDDRGRVIEITYQGYPHPIKPLVSEGTIASNEQIEAAITINESIKNQMKNRAMLLDILRTEYFDNKQTSDDLESGAASGSYYAKSDAGKKEQKQAEALYQAAEQKLKELGFTWSTFKGWHDPQK